MVQYNKATIDLQHELVNVENEIQVLVKKRRNLKSKIKRQGHKPVSNKTRKDYEKYFSATIRLYVLQLENDCWYIGQSRNIEKRFAAHAKGKGANWTKANTPLSIYLTKDTGLTDEQEVALLEDKLTLEYAKKYGISKVRGGGYCQTKPHWPISIVE